MISIAKPKIGMAEAQAVMDVIKGKIIAQGDKVEQFEAKFAEYIGTKYAVACNSGTSALHISYLCSNLKPGDSVITTPFTFRSTISMLEAIGVKPIFVDIKDDYNINESKIEGAIDKTTKAIVPVHLFGKPCNMNKIMSIAKKHKLKVIEDCAQSCGAEYRNNKVGSIGDIGIFSFYPTKIMTTGEGGMITTNNKEVVELAKKIRNHGMDNKGNFVEFGYNYRMTNIAAAIGLEQLEKIETFIRTREEIAKNYNYYLEEHIDPIKEELDIRHVFNNFSFRVKNRDMFIKNMRANGIDVRIYYEKPFADLPNVTKISKEIVSIPIRPNLTSEEVNHIIYNIQELM